MNSGGVWKASPMAKIVALVAGKLVLLAIVILGVLYYLS